jgi:hypothetical protein
MEMKGDRTVLATRGCAESRLALKFAVILLVTYGLGR